MGQSLMLWEGKWVAGKTDCGRRWRVYSPVLNQNIHRLPLHLLLLRLFLHPILLQEGYWAPNFPIISEMSSFGEVLSFGYEMVSLREVVRQNG